MLKRSILLCALLSSQVAFSGGMGEVCQGRACSDEKYKIWEIGAEGLYYRPNLGAYSYAGTINLAPGLDNINRQNALDLDQAWGYRIEGSFFFGNSSDVKLYWSQLDDTTKQNVTNDFGGTTNQLNTITTKVDWDDVVFELGQRFRFDKTTVRFNGGLEYSEIKVNQNIYDVISPAATATLAFQYKYEGIGPRIGLDVFYNVVGGFNLYSKGALAVLVGNTNVVDNVNYSPPSVANPTSSSGKKNHYTVPVFNIDLGANYEFDLEYGLMTVQGGWRFIEYSTPLSSYNSSSNFSLQGPYLGLKWAGMGA